MYKDARSQFKARHHALLRDGLQPIIDFLDQHAVKLSQRLHGEVPHTLMHGDYRRENLFFDERESETRVIVADWQLVGRGAGAYDVGYFIGGALDVDVSNDIELNLVRGYHSALVAGGVPNHDWERCLAAYRRALLSTLQIVASWGAMDMGEDRGVELMDLWLHRTYRRLQDVDLEALL